MSLNPFLQNNDQMNDNLYTSNGYDKRRLSVTVIMFLSVLVVVGILTFVFQGGQDKYTKAATTAARKVTPNAEVSNLKVAGGFALASVSSPTASGQGVSGNITIFKLNRDGSMMQIASGSYLGPINLLELGVPLATQAKLTGTSIGRVKQNLANQCGYNGGNTPGYSGFGGSFNPGGWEIDAGTLSYIEQVLSGKVSNMDAGAKPGETVICVVASTKNSNSATDPTTYINTSSLQLQFITASGTLTIHTFTFANGFNNYRNYTLDGQTLAH